MAELWPLASRLNHVVLDERGVELDFVNSGKALDFVKELLYCCAFSNLQDMDVCTDSLRHFVEHARVAQCMTVPIGYFHTAVRLYLNEVRVNPRPAPPQDGAPDPDLAKA